MTSTVEDFIKDKPLVVTATLQDSLVDVSRRMIEHDYSQLPIVDSDNKPIGLITSDSILRALNNYGVSLADIHVKHTTQKILKLFRKDIDLLDLFDEMNDSQVGIIVDDEQKIVQIITSYDTAVYFRQRANDTLLVENIENTIKDYVQLSFSSDAGGDAKLDNAIQKLTNSSLALHEKFEKALKNYLGKTQQSPIDSEIFEAIFEKYFDDKRLPATFDDLTLDNYISLFLHKAFWDNFEQVLGLSKPAVTHILQSVRRTRNDLSHFREITRDQSYQLRDCYDLLVSHQDEINQIFSQSNKEIEEVIEAGEEQTYSEKPVLSTYEDEPIPGESKYAPLAIWLQEQPSEKELVKPTFAKIEEIIGGKLPDSAYKNRSWWANDSVGHVQSKQWLDVGWRVASVNMSNQVARFARIKERQKDYIDFFSVLINALSQEPGFSSINMRPDGHSWHFIRSLSTDSRMSFNYAFGRGDVFRVEIYFSTDDKNKNKQLFDAVHGQKEQIETAIGHELSWQRLENRRASRISRIFKGQITDSEAELMQLCQKAVPATINFVRVFEPKVNQLAKEIL